MVRHKFTKRGSEPQFERYTETHFFAGQQLRRQPVAEGLHKHVFSSPVVDLPTGRNGSCEVGEMMVQQRTSHLQRVGHRHAIHLDKHVPGQVSGRFKIHGLRDDISIARRQTLRKSPRQESGIRRNHPLGRQQSPAQIIRCVIVREIALQSRRAAQHPKVVLAVSGIRQLVSNER